MENNENKKEEVLEIKKVTVRETDLQLMAVVGLLGMGATYLLGRRMGIRVGYAIGFTNGYAWASKDFTIALSNYTKEITSKGD